MNLAEAYAYPDSSGRGHWLRALMIASADGHAEADGRSGGLSGPADVALLRTLRGLADVVLVGSATARIEGYGPAMGPSPVPAIAVVSASLDVDFDSPLYTDAVVPTITVTVADAPPDRLDRARASGDVLIAGDGGRVDLPAAVDALARTGRGKLLCEGGPKLLSAAIAAGCVDELCLTISPQLRAGAGPRILDGPALPIPIELSLHSVLAEDGFLFVRYLVC